MKYYRRKTHINGVFRSDKAESWNLIPDIFSGLIHVLDPIKWKCLSDVISVVFEYASQYPLENDAHWFGDPVLCEATLDLLALFDMVEIKEEK